MNYTIELEELNWRWYKYLPLRLSDVGTVTSKLIRCSSSQPERIFDPFLMPNVGVLKNGSFKKKS